ncbi:hypothetical protein JGU66_34075 [Myxococcaceae bacterium JPH2]|nr:hypothetical protein [Myxococcaceae bacterium JPH2]
MQACGGPVSEGPEALDVRPAQVAGALEAGAETEDILTRLQSIPGLTVVTEAPSPIQGTRFFRLTFEQPADHHRPNGEHFQLRATLLHRSTTAPVVVYSGGYSLSSRPSQYEPTALLGANQLSLEHRFFGPSRPASNDWKLLDIWQAASDYHCIIQAFKPVYSGHWLTTGGSKGGMAAVYHRYYYPNDVDATVAYVAPNTHGLDDGRFVHFLERVGDETCREKLRVFQRDALSRRSELLPFMADTGDTYGVLGVERSLEFGIVEMPFYFWQYGTPSLCDAIPAPGATATQVFAFLDYITGMASTYGDSSLDYFAAYYYQSATELGWNRYPTRHLHGLLQYPREDVPSEYLAFPLEKRFDHALMLRVEHWVRREGTRMMFLYGDRDPWSAGPFDVRACNDSLRFTVPNANHLTAQIVRLPEAERTLAMTRLASWMGVTLPDVNARALAPASTEDIAPVVEDRPRL